MKRYYLEKPDLSKVNPIEVLGKILADRLIPAEIYKSTSHPKYFYWDKIKYKKTYIENLSPEELWTAIKFLRKTYALETDVKSDSGKNFTWIKFPDYEQIIHELDLNTGGHLFTGRSATRKEDRYKYISKGIMEEAIASSQLEGANTTRKYAKQFLKEGRQPKNKSEQMILNTYRTMVEIDSDYCKQKLDMNLLLELHHKITEQTVPPNEQGQLRSDEDQIVVSDSENRFIYHVAPKIDFVRNELERLILFANDELNSEFIHPIPKAIMLHFWIAYLHPFTDGNGRLARVIFYWYLLRHGYWAISYLPISKRIRMSSAQYKKAYLYTEQDDLDLTYFIHYNLSKIVLAKNDFLNYLETKSEKQNTINQKVGLEYGLNERQLELMVQLKNNPSQRVTSIIHANTHQITRATSISDLKVLTQLGFLKEYKEGRRSVYLATDKMNELF